MATCMGSKGDIYICIYIAKNELSKLELLA